jgi:quinolinate synthase
MNTIDKINRLKKLKNAIILAHYYQPDEIQEIADFVGDSLDLSRKAQQNDADTIVFCGVDFMAGSAKLLAPQKTVLLPENSATCPMANMATAEKVLELRRKYPNAAVVTYINSTVAVKTVSDICCTSSNAIKVVNSISADEIIFLPDKNLGAYIQRFTDKKIILWNGHCCVHNNLTLGLVKQAKQLHPEAELVVHPECLAEVIDAASFCGSTSKIIEYVGKSESGDFIVGTEEGILYQLKKENPDKRFYLASKGLRCGNMKKITLDKILISLEKGIYNIDFAKDIIEKAALPIKRMLEIK